MMPGIASKKAPDINIGKPKLLPLTPNKMTSANPQTRRPKIIAMIKERYKATAPAWADRDC